ncbi:MAG TPA: pyridoxal phosphate-dependent aminotransferase [Hypericibacter adhaerens]|jgi:aspartate/methionine/tyrosine aminotransferase|uniref:aspartate transaminase n=1 Tax=Hypericibacter adhaerens TaxID=2602016 RepID=A0A5J6MXC0_9PROT|nr:pyridoxal phosphate-dependent aminotransferase [Hypericibacter adhaerens]QEX22382.1 aspartate aminotransferase [Hypericibacter adhaerens]HWA45978.1 pyridoxal phosphate-dependent aminotransferase [Hypericibacter adhaerens]
MLQLASGMSRLGTESAFEVLARANALAAAGKSIINLGIGQPDFKTPAHIVEAAIKALKDGHHGYTPANGIPQLREAVSADLHRRHGVTVDPAQVVVVPGGKVTMFFAILMFGEPGAEIIYPNPGFPIYESAINFTGAKAVPLPLLEKNGFGFSADDLLSRITDKTRLIIINSPANPTGGVTADAEVEKLVKGLEKWPNVAIMSDEIYSEILYEGRKHLSLLRYEQLRDRLIMLDGWSKTYAMTGWRMGYAVWPGKLAELATRLAINCHSCVNASAQYAGIAALTGPKDDVAKMCKAFDERRRFVVDALNKLPGVSCVDALGAFYVFPNVSKLGMSSKQVETGLLNDAGIATIAGTSFGSHGEGYIRVSYANSLENIAEAMRRFGDWLAQRKAA